MPQAGHTFFRVQAPAAASAPLSGRLLIFLKAGSGDSAVNTDELSVAGVWVAAREVASLAPGGSVDLDADEIAYPRGFSALPPRKYEVQAVLDPNHSYNYTGRNHEDWVSDAVSLGGWSPGRDPTPTLTLDRHPRGDLMRPAGYFAMMADVKLGNVRKEEFVSPLLSGFWGQPVKIAAWIVLPPGYSDRREERYPTAYWTHGFGGDLASCLLRALDFRRRMKNGEMPPMIWVMLDESIPQGTHEFADSVNNGPWGTALTSEFIPYLESKYRMDARPSSRFLTGHSSGGWAALQLQVNYPQVFGGVWATSPDSADFHDFNGVDLYAPNANLYRNSDGSPVPIVRENGKVVATMQEVAQLEKVIGPYGGQFASFDWVFSPKGPDGAPLAMFDRLSGRVNSDVVAYWREHYDLAHLVKSKWAHDGADLKGKIRVTVGTADTFYLDGAAHSFEAVLTRLGADPHFAYLPGCTHFDVYMLDGDPEGLANSIAGEMYAAARPGSSWRPRK